MGDGLTIKLQAPLAPYTSWKVGGVADRLCLAESSDGLASFLSTLPEEEPLLWIGRGSNLLVRDGGVRGTVVLLSQGQEAVTVEGERIHAGAGVSLARLARTARGAGWHGFDFLAGIPGSVGGGLAMNAGAFGQEIWGLVESVEVMDRYGRVSRQSADAYTVGYRSVVPLTAPAEGWFVSATFARRSLPERDESQTLQQQLNTRNRTQPMAEYSCGSVFRNPPGAFAGRLIEQSGLKGYCIGAACVSRQHANFIVHRGEANAEQIETLIEYVIAAVEQKQGVTLKPEVRIVGERR